MYLEGKPSMGIACLWLIWPALNTRLFEFKVLGDVLLERGLTNRLRSVLILRKGFFFRSSSSEAIVVYELMLIVAKVKLEKKHE